MCFAVLSHSVVSYSVAHQAPLSMGILQARLLEWVAIPSSRGSSQLRDQTQVSCIAGGLLTRGTTREAPKNIGIKENFDKVVARVMLKS